MKRSIFLDHRLVPSPLLLALAAHKCVAATLLKSRQYPRSDDDENEEEHEEEEKDEDDSSHSESSSIGARPTMGISFGSSASQTATIPRTTGTDRPPIGSYPMTSGLYTRIRTDTTSNIYAMPTDTYATTTRTDTAASGRMTRTATDIGIPKEDDYDGDGDHKRLSTGGIVGIVLGVLALFCLLAVFIFRRRNRLRRDRKRPPRPLFLATDIAPFPSNSPGSQMVESRVTQGATALGRGLTVLTVTHASRSESEVPQSPDTQSEIISTFPTPPSSVAISRHSTNRTLFAVGSDNTHTEMITYQKSLKHGKSDKGSERKDGEVNDPPPTYSSSELSHD